MARRQIGLTRPKGCNLPPAPQQPIRPVRRQAGGLTRFREGQAARNPFVVGEKPPALPIRLPLGRLTAQAERAALAGGPGLCRIVGRRNTRPLQVARGVPQHRTAALDRGQAWLGPVTLADGAGVPEVQESSVSRLVAGISSATPQGTWQRRALFGPRVGDRSAAAIRAQTKAALVVPDRSLPARTGRCHRMDRVLRKNPRRLPDGTIILTCRKGGLSFRSGTTAPPERSRKRNQGRYLARREQSASHRRVGPSPGGFGPRRACGTRSAWPVRWPRPDRDRRAQAEQCPAFPPAVHAVGTHSASC
jgi:hypothetical protein